MSRNEHKLILTCSSQCHFVARFGVRACFNRCRWFGSRTNDGTGQFCRLAAAFTQRRADNKILKIDNLKSAIRFLRSENALLKSRDLYQDLHTLPPITYHSYMPTPTSLPELSTSFSTPSSPSSSTSHDDFPVTPTKQSLETESKLLYKKVIEYQSSCRIVDISQLGDGGMTGIDDVGGGAGRTRPHWRSKKFSPEKQIWEWRVEEVKLQKRVEILKERMRGLSAGGGFRRRI